DPENLILSFYEYIRQMSEKVHSLFMEDDDFALPLQEYHVVKLDVKKAKEALIDFMRFYNIRRVGNATKIGDVFVTDIKPGGAKDDILQKYDKLCSDKINLQEKFSILRHLFQWCTQVPMFGFNSGI